MDKEYFYKQLQGEESVLLKEIKTLNETLAALQVLLSRYQPNNYHDDLKAETKSDGNEPKEQQGQEKTNTGDQDAIRRTGNKVKHVLDALKSIKEGTSNEVGKKLTEMHPEYNAVEANNVSRNILSKLNGKGKVVSEKVEGKTYFIYKYVGQEVADIFAGSTNNGTINDN